MIGKNPLRVGKQLGHSVQTMLETYAAWLDGTTEADLQAIKHAMEGPAKSAPTPRPSFATERVSFRLPPTSPLRSQKTVTGLSLERLSDTQVPDNYWKILAEREGFELDSDPLSDQQVTDLENNPVPDDPQETP